MKQTTYILLFVSFFLAQEIVCNAKKAFITGVTGQDGFYLAQLLLEKGYEVHALLRLTNNATKQLSTTKLTDELSALGNFVTHFGDAIDGARLSQIVMEIQPDEIYNLAAQSHVQTSFEKPTDTLLAGGVAVYNLLDAINKAGLLKRVKLFQASTSAIFGQSIDTPQTENTLMCPNSPYAITKMCAHWAVKNYRDAYGLFACNGILFNHESPRRGADFVTRKITLAASRIKKGSDEVLRLGNLNAHRDWGYVGDYVEAMWLMLQQDVADDYIIATGKTHTVRDFVNAAFKAINIEIIWQGIGVEEKGIDKKTGKVIVEVDPKFFRPLENAVSVGNIEKITQKIGWIPKVSFEDLVKLMVVSDLSN